MKNLKNKIIVGASVSIMFFMNVFNSVAQKAEFGIRYMPTFSSFDVQSSAGGTIEGEVTLGFGMGAFLGFNFSKHFGIQGEVIYTSMSQKYRDVDVDHEINLRYINIPLLFSVNTGKTNAVNLNVVAGPQLGLNVGSDVSSTSSDGTTSTSAILSLKKSDIGFAYGFGVDFALNNSHTTRLGVGYRGVLGLFDISDNEKSLTNDDYYVIDRAHIKTNAAYIGISFLF